jgi:hypothetical protein
MRRRKRGVAPLVSFREQSDESEVGVALDLSEARREVHKMPRYSGGLRAASKHGDQGPLSDLRDRKS